MASLAVENVYKSYSRTKANSPPDTTVNEAKAKANQSVSVLRNINFTVEDGEFLVLVGPSGCGKSTLLRLLAGLEELTGGNIQIGDLLVNNLPPKARDIAMVFQNYALYPHLDIYDNIAFGLRRSSYQSTVTTQQSTVKKVSENLLAGATRYLPRKLRYMSAKEKLIRDRVRYVSSLLQIDDLLYRLPKELSGGQKQRVALGRAISRNPQVFLMDEPLSNLDAKLRTQTRAQIVQLQRQLKTTTVYVTHDQVEAMTMGDRIAVMNQGIIQQIAPPLEIYQRPVNRFVAEFIGSPPMNFFLVNLAHASLRHPAFELELKNKWVKSLQSLSSNSFTLGIRPQHLSISDRRKSSIEVTVDLVEALGSETYISAHLNLEPETTLTASLPPNQQIAIGDSIWLAIDIEQIHLFTVDDERAVIVK